VLKESCGVLLGYRRRLAKTRVSNINVSKFPQILLDRRRRSKYVIKTRPWTGLPRRIMVRFPVRAREFSLNRPVRLWGPPCLTLIEYYEGLYPRGVKGLRREAPPRLQDRS
jgi:hypothetical protein